MHCCVKLGDLVNEGDIIAHIDTTPVLSPLQGMVRGLLSEGLEVSAGFKIGDVDPRGAQADLRPSLTKRVPSAAPYWKP